MGRQAELGSWSVRNGVLGAHPRSQGCRPSLGAHPGSRGVLAELHPRGPLECYGCYSKGHPQSLCPTPPGMAGKPGAQVCELCHGKKLSKSQCTSKGGGKWTDPSLNQKGKGAGSYGQQGKGKGKFGGKGFGKCKGKFNSFDEGFAPSGFAPPGFEQQWQPQW